VAKKIKAGLQLQVHTDLFNENFSKKSLSNIIKTDMAKFLLSQASGIRVVSEGIANSIKKEVNTKSEPFVLPIYVDVAAISSHVPLVDLKKKYGFSKVVLVASRFSKEKNLPLAVESFARVAKILPDVCMVMAGSGVEEENVRNLVRRLDLSKRVFLEGWSNDVYSLLKTSDVFLLTSEYEGYGMTIVEALAAGLPVVSTDVGVAKEAGAIVVTKDAQEISNAMLKILKGETGSQKLAARFRSSKEEYLQNFKKSMEICTQQN
jgi:glycosyltransferase involved in cell wall biosynthesis